MVGKRITGHLLMVLLEIVQAHFNAISNVPWRQYQLAVSYHLATAMYGYQGHLHIALHIHNSYHCFHDEDESKVFTEFTVAIPVEETFKP